MYFVRGSNSSYEEHAEFTEARERASALAKTNHRESYYVGTVGCDPRDEERWCFDLIDGRSIPYACND